MSDYIKREDAMELIDKCVSHTSPKAEAIDFDFRHGEVNGLNWACDIIEAMPSADVAPVVRCKDCRHAVDYYHEGDCYCSNPKWGLNYFGGSWEFYCADAERRNNE